MVKATSTPAVPNFVRAEMLPSGYLIRPCEGGGSIIHIVDHMDIEAHFFSNITMFYDNNKSGLTKEVLKLDVEFFEYKAEAKASMDALEKKIDDGIGKLDASIKAMKEGWDAKFEELKNSGWIRKRAIDREMQHMGEQIFGAGLELIVGLDSRAFEGLNCHLGKGEERITWNPRIKHHSPRHILLTDFTLRKSKTKLGSRNHVAQDFKGGAE
ncbi:class III HD-Zip protein HDZ32 [Tanacetum coccineum]